MKGEGVICKSDDQAFTAHVLNYLLVKLSSEEVALWVKGKEGYGLQKDNQITIGLSIIPSLISLLAFAALKHFVST